MRYFAACGPLARISDDGELADVVPGKPEALKSLGPFHHPAPTVAAVALHGPPELPSRPPPWLFEPQSSLFVRVIQLNKMPIADREDDCPQDRRRGPLLIIVALSVRV